MEKENIENLISRLRKSDEKKFVVARGLTIKGEDREWYATQIEENIELYLDNDDYQTDEDIINSEKESYIELFDYYSDMDDDEIDNMFD